MEIDERAAEIDGVKSPMSGTDHFRLTTCNNLLKYARICPSTDRLKRIGGG